MDDTIALVLAAGKGTRMYSGLAKVLHPICGRPMLSYILSALQELRLTRVLVVVGHQAGRIKRVHADAPVEWVLQAEQLGTAHAVQCALPYLADFVGSVLICCGDTPLLTGDTLLMFQREHVNRSADLSILSMLLENPGNYGRVLRDSRGAVLGIVEAKDASDRESSIREVNTGIYCVKADVLRAAIPDIDNTNAQGEYYLTDLVRLAVQRGWKARAVTASDPAEFLGVNTQEELAAAETIIARRAQGQ